MSMNKNLRNTNMCYSCEYCQQGFDHTDSLRQVAISYFICVRCCIYYKLTHANVLKLRYVENREEWRDTGMTMWFPYPMGFDEEDVSPRQTEHKRSLERSVKLYG